MSLWGGQMEWGNFMTIKFILEIIGTVAFAFSGAMMGMKKKLDIFGVIFLAVIVSVGGGCLRDMILNVGIPVMFTDPTYVLIAVAVAIFLFIWVYVKHGNIGNETKLVMDNVMKYADSIGLAVFTVSGIRRAFEVTESPNIFLAVVVGVMTGVGGGVLRDVLVGMKPYIFVKHVYALSSIIGGTLCAVMWVNHMEDWGMFLGAAVILVIRFLAIRFEWNLPKVAVDDDTIS